ncbi:MAG TPA: type II toxin-antitoxin system VapC family toxin [Polyangiales bacterium]
MSREVVLDANVIVAWLDSADSLAARAQELMTRLRGENAEIVLVDITITEALSVLCRRAAQRRTSPPDLTKALETVRRWGEQGSIRWLAREQERLLPEILDIIATTSGRLNFNDALLVVLQRDGSIGEVASFDGGFDSVPTFTRLS